MRVRKVSLFGLPLFLAVVVLLVPLVGFAQGSGFYTVSQGATQVPIVPLANAGEPSAFYKITNMQAATGFEKPSTAILFLYQNTLNGQISLFVILSAAGGTAGSTKITLSGVPAGAKWQVQDDGAGDFREVWALTPPTGSASWTWDQGRGDGLVLGPLGTDFQLSLFPEFTAGITDVRFLSGDRVAPQTITLNRLDPIIVGAAQNQPPAVSFSVSTADARVNQPITFDASTSRDADGSIAKYEWDFNGDGVFDQTTTAATVSYTYASSGTKSVTVRATDNEGATGRGTQTVVVGRTAGEPAGRLADQAARERRSGVQAVHRPVDLRGPDSRQHDQGHLV